MDFFEIEPYRLAGEHGGKLALTLTRIGLDEFGVDELPFHGGPVFENEEDALRFGVRWVASRGGRVRKTVLQSVSEDEARERRGEPKMTTDRIEINANVMMGKPVIKGTRIKVELILRKLAEGATEDELLDAYPRLTREDIHAAIAYAADTIAHEEIILLPTPPTTAKS